MDFDEHVLFPMHNAGMQDGVQFYNPTAGIFLLLASPVEAEQGGSGTELSRNMSMEKGLKGGKRKGSGEGSSTMHSQQEETGGMSQREVSMERAGEKEGDAASNREDYVHIRAKRGQATNNHSLAERFRREKINERMKHLQDLVPGCNKKITGKAMMLDEIINYVQSLQRQVEFLSMKLSAVSPELNCDLDLQDILCPQDARSAFPGYGQRLGSVHPNSNMYRASQPGLSRPELYGNGIIIPNPANVHMARAAQQLSAFPQRSIVWDEELGNVGPAAFPSDVVGASSLENSESMKVE
ncbi:Transcription factor bHLH62 [Triticum urartu]|uniref:BHLH domain-containing protein n=2 Tax=Triticum TaxID=4564 RepID=A0A9R0S550_TRITD|nr:Transcription factor bHLH62 [Triticum urartu]VAH88453.1 unnamed protein product [Triticum turgidum subsp. durum]